MVLKMGNLPLIRRLTEVWPNPPTRNQEQVKKEFVTRCAIGTIVLIYLLIGPACLLAVALEICGDFFRIPKMCGLFGIAMCFIQLISEVYKPILRASYFSGGGIQAISQPYKMFHGKIGLFDIQKRPNAQVLYTNIRKRRHLAYGPPVGFQNSQGRSTESQN